MTSQARTALSQLKASLDRIDQVRNDPNQMQQLVQEIRRHVEQLESQLDRD